MNEEKHRIDIIQGEGGGGGCFSAGTLISTPDGSINIEGISVGDEVYSFDDSGKISVNKVTKVFVHENNDIYSFKFWGGELLLNSIHWILNGRNTFFQGKHFDTDECVVDESGEFRPFKSLEFLRVGTVYNFWVENDHTYIANGVRVHNGGGGGGKGQVAQARTPVEDPEGIVYGDDKDDRYVSLSKLQIMDMICEGPVKGLVRGGYKYEGSIGNVGYDTARFISYRSQIGAMEGITAEIEQKCSYGVKLLEKKQNSITVQIRVESDATFYMNFRPHESPEPGKGHEGTKMWISSGPHNPTYPKVISVTGPSNMPGFAPTSTRREAPAITDVNGGDNFLSGNWKAYETWQAGKNHPNGPTAKSYDFVGTLPKIHDDAKAVINEVKGKWSGDIGGTAVSWVPYVTKNYSADLVTVTQSPSPSNEYETIVRVDPSEENIDAEINLPSKIVDGVVVGPASGRRVNPAWWAVTFTLHGESQVPICKLATDPPPTAGEEEIITDGFEYLRSIFWNGIPILDSTGLLNFQQVSLNYTTGVPNGIRSDQAESLVKGTSKVRVAGEKLKGPTQELDEDDKLTGTIISDLDDFAQVYRVSNKNCNGITVNIRVGSLSVLLKEDETLKGQPATHAVGTIDLGFAPVQSSNRNQPTKTPAEATAESTGHGDPIEGGSGDLLRTSIIYIIQWKPVFDTVGEYREWPSLFRATKKYGTGPNSEITAEEETGQIEETLWGKISYGYNKSTRINFARHAELYNRAGFLGWEIRIIRTTPESISPSIQNTTYTDSLVEHYDVELSYPNSAAVTATFDAEYFSEPPGRSFDVEMLKVKVPSNYNPVLRTYGQNRGGCNETAFRTAFYSLTPFVYAGAEAATLPKGAVPDHAVDTINALVTKGSPTYEPSKARHPYPFSEAIGTVTDIVEANQDPNVQSPTHPVRLNTTGIYSPTIGGGMPLVSGADGYVNGTEEYWDGNFKSDLNGTIVKQYTNNPAWCFYDLITNKRYGLGNHIDSSLMDKWSLYEIGKYCDELVDDGDGGIEPRFTCNLLISSREEAFKVLNDMSSVFRGMLYYHGGLIQAVQDSPKEPMYQFTNSNVENGEFGYQSTSRKVRRNVAVIRYNDPDDEYKPAVEYVENLPEIKKFGIRELEITAFGCTSRGQARRLGNWALISESLETESCSFSVGLEGAYLRPGDVVQIFDYNRKQRAHGGRTQKFETVGLTGAKVTLDREITGLSGTYDTYKFSMLTPSHYLDPSLIDEGEMNSADSPEIRNNLIQSVYFTADQTRPVSGVTTIRFDYSTPVSTGWNGRHGVAYAPDHITSSETYSDSFGEIAQLTPPEPGGWTEAQIELNHLRADRTVTPTGKWPITGFNTFTHNLTGDTQFVWTIEKSGTRTPIDKNYSLYKLITIEEKDVSKYNVRAIEHQTGKFVMAESGIAFDRTTYAQTPADPDSILLDTPNNSSTWEGPPNSIRYTIISNKKDTATVGFQVYVISSPYGFTTLDTNPDGVPHAKYLAARVDNIDPQGYYIPGDEGFNMYWFRVFAINAANDLSSNYVESMQVMLIPKLINNVIISSLSLLNPLNTRLEEEDKSTGPGPDFKYNTDVSLNINTGPGVNFTEMTFATGQLLNASPTFGWQAGFVGLKPGMKASTNFKYRLTIREPSTFGLSTEDRATLFNTALKVKGGPHAPVPSKNILYEITGLSASSSETKFVYHSRLNITEAKQTTILFDANGSPIDPFIQSSIPGDGNPTMGIGGPYRDYDVVIEAHDDQGFSSASAGIELAPFIGGPSCLYRADDGARKDVEYSNGKGFDIMYVSNPRPGSVVLLDDVRNAALAIPAQDIQFTFNDNILPIDAVGVVAWISSQPFSHEDLHHAEFTSARWNANRNGFLVEDYFGRLNTDDYYSAYNSNNIFRANDYQIHDMVFPAGPIYRSLFSFENLSITDSKTASFNISSLIEESKFFTTAYVIVAVYDAFDHAEMTNFMETNGGASDINILSAQNLMCHNLILSKDKEGGGDGAAITDIVGQANKLVAYISVEAINKVENEKGVQNVKWTHLGFSSYSVKRIGGALIGRKRVVQYGRYVWQNQYAPETYEHTAHFNPDKVGFKSGDDYMLRISSNVLSVAKYPDASKETSEPKTYNEQKIVWKSESKGHADLDRAMTLDIYRI